MKNDTTLFTAAHIKALQDMFGKIQRVNPDSETLAKIRALIASQPIARLEQLAGANIKWVSYFAKQGIEARTNDGSKAVAELAKMFGNVPVADAPEFRAQRNADMGDAVRAHLGMGAAASIPPRGKPTQMDIENFRNKLAAFFEAHRAATYPNNPSEGVSVEHGRKYARIFRGSSCYAFISLETGEIFMPANYKAPAKHARGSIYQADSELFGEGKVCGPYGVRYLK